MRYIATLLLLAACAVLPDRVYVEASEREISDFYDREWLGTVGVEYDLQPQSVVIRGQTEEHPWDLLGGLDLGVYEPPEDAPSPTPIFVRDADMAELIGAVHVTLDDLTETNARLASDIHELRTALLGTGTGGGLLLLLLGGAAVRRRRAHPEPEATP